MSPQDDGGGDNTNLVDKKIVAWKCKSFDEKV